MDEKIIIYKIDSNDNIYEVNYLWDDFAKENDGLPENSSQNIIGKNLWSFIKDFETKHIYKILVENVRKFATPITIPLMCDAPHIVRFINLEIVPLDDNRLEFRSKIIKEVHREKIDLLDRNIPRSDEFIKMCSYCKAIKINEEKWVETEKAISSLKLFYKRAIPQISHGICPACYDNIMKELEIFKQQQNKKTPK